MIVGKLVGIAEGGAANPGIGIAVDMVSSTVNNLTTWSAADDAMVARSVKAYLVGLATERLVPAYAPDFFSAKLTDIIKGGTIAASAADAIMTTVHTSLDAVVVNHPADAAAVAKLIATNVLHITLSDASAVQYGNLMASSNQAANDLYDTVAFMLGSGTIDPALLTVVGVNGSGTVV
jgi:hypothetical protein